MGRPRSFDTADVLVRAAELFVRRGYEGTSVDDLVGGLGLHRGSLYKAFGSKRGLFLAVLTDAVRRALPAAVGEASPVRALTERAVLDPVLVAALELAPHDEEAAALVEEAYALVATVSRDPARVLGTRLLHRARTGRALDPEEA